MVHRIDVISLHIEINQHFLSLFMFILGSGGLGPLLLRKRRSKSRRAPAPPTRSVTSPEQARLLDEAEATASTSTPTTSAAGRS